MALQNEKNSRYLLRDWKPENPAFWENKGKHMFGDVAGECRMDLGAITGDCHDRRLVRDE
ncbi:hypothetical protein AAIM49_004552 [Escherichia coli]